MSDVTKVAVIGAGFSGLTAIKCCLDEGLEVVCFEREPEVGGLWRYSEGGDKGSVCRSTVINSSRDMMSFSDFPIPAHYPLFMHNTKVFEYALDYAKEFDLLRHIQFNMNVVHVARAADYEMTGKWIIIHEECGKEIVSRKTDCFDAVLLCTGHHWQKNYPSYPGMGDFNGLQMHSKDYRDVKGLEGKTVVVVGFGNSGGDVAVDVSRYSHQVYLSTRRGAWIASRLMNGYPRDKMTNRRYLQYWTPRWAKHMITKARNEKRFDHTAYGLKPQHGVLSQHTGVNDDVPLCILNGLIRMKPDVKLLSHNSVVFEDESIVEDVDCMIYSTGFRFGFPFIEADVINVENNRLPCYKYMFAPHLKHHTLAVIGFVQPLGSLIPVSEMQARVALKVFTKQCHLPTEKGMLTEIAEREKKTSASYYSSPRHTIQVNYVDYMDDMAKMIGCTPHFWKLLFSDPLILYHWYFGPCIPAQFRLFGPNSWPKARQVVIDTDKLTLAASMTRVVKQEVKSWVVHPFSLIVIAIAVCLCLVSGWHCWPAS